MNITQIMKIEDAALSNKRVNQPENLLEGRGLAEKQKRDRIFKLEMDKNNTELNATRYNIMSRNNDPQKDNFRFKSNDFVVNPHQMRNTNGFLRI